MSDQKIFLAEKIFTGEQWLNDSAVIINDGIVEDVVPASTVAKNLAVKNFPGSIIAPAFIDLQTYGALGKLLAVYPEPDTLDKMNEYNRRGGTAFCLPTVATNTMDVFYKCIDAVKKYWRSGGKGILGLHIEGPWINPVKRGAHIASLIHPPAKKEIEDLLNYGKGVIKMITLAPEVCDKKFVDLILSYNIIVSAGHSNVSFREAMRSFENGISSVTHLYNAMSPLHHREPGLVGAAFISENVVASIIPDGHHVDFASIRIAKKIMGERLFAITDSVTETNEGFYHHHFVGDKYEAGGILSGSALTMVKALQNLVRSVGIDLAEALRMCGLYPARVLKLENKFGRIQKNYAACLVVLNENLEILSLFA